MDGPASKVIVAWHMVLLRHVPSPATLPLTRADTPLQLTASLACSCQHRKPREACSGVWLGAWHELTALACRLSQESSVAFGKCHSRACHFGGVDAYPYKRAHHELSITSTIERCCAAMPALRSRLSAAPVSVKYLDRYCSSLLCTCEKPVRRAASIRCAHACAQLSCTTSIGDRADV